MSEQTGWTAVDTAVQGWDSNGQAAQGAAANGGTNGHGAPVDGAVPFGSGPAAPEEARHPITHDTMFLIVNLRMLGIKRKIRKLEEDAHIQSQADKDMLEHEKWLIDPKCPQYRRMQSVQSSVRTWVREHQLACSFLKKGHYLMSTEMAPDVEAFMVGKQREMEAAVDAFLAVWYEEFEKARGKLRQQFDESQYPTTDAIRDACQIRFKWETVNRLPTQLATVHAGAMARETERARQECLGMAAEVRHGLRRKMAVIVQHMTAVLASDSTRDWKNSSVQKVINLLEIFDRMNAARDQELASLVGQARALVVGRTAQQLRDNAPLRATIQGGMAELVAQFQGLVQAAPPRQLVNLWDGDDGE